MLQFTDRRTAPSTLPPSFSFADLGQDNCQHCLLNLDARHVIGCVHLSTSSAWKRRTHATVLTHPHVLRLRNPASAHLSAQSCVPDQTPPRPQLIQCDNDLLPLQAWPSSYRCSSPFSLLLVGR